MDFEKFKSLLDEQMNWPDYYSFKFVVKLEHRDNLLELLQEHTISEKSSKQGNYISITSRKLVHSSDDVVEVYQKVSTIEGILSL